jgi:hypothetical protein
MRVKPPRVPSAAQVAGSSQQGPRVVPGAYTLRLAKNGKVYTQTLALSLDRRAKFTLADRQQNFDATMKVHALFGDMSNLIDRINAAKGLALMRAQTLPAGDALRKRLEDFAERTEVLRKQIVATKEGGAITGEERLREFADQLYGALLSYEGKPGTYHVARTAVLRRELNDVVEAFNGLTTKELPALNQALKDKQMEGLAVPR